MASDWDSVPLSELTATPVTYGIVQPGRHTPGGIPMLRVNNFQQNSLSLSEVLCVSPLIESKYGRTRLQVDDVLLTVVGSVGQVAIVPEQLAGWNIARAVALIRLAKPEYSHWAALVLRSPSIQHQLGVAANTTVQTTINLKDLRDLRIPLPPKAIRENICQTLGALDDRIDNLRQTNATLEAITQALFKSWFVDFDPVRAKAEGREPEGMDATTAALFPSEFEDSEFGPIPKGWYWSTLGDAVEKNGGMIQTGPFGSQLHASDYQPIGVPVVMPQDLSGRRVSEERIARVSESDAERLSRHRMQNGDIVFSRRGDVGRHAVISDREVGWLCGTGCLLVQPGEAEATSSFFSAALARPESQEWLVRHAVGATMPNLNTKILSALPLLWPRDELAHAYESTASSLNDRVSANLAQARSFAKLRDTLLPRLISGKLRLEPNYIPSAEA